ncbi:MAG: glyoxylate reductase [Candidatus Bathyarchaeota archaeon B23]|nr:MAG: glyoxylate reductase [Candidatus Bathyarchaeota archaeon B23]
MSGVPNLLNPNIINLSPGEGVLERVKVFVTRRLFDEAINLIEEYADVEVFESEEEPAPYELILEKVREIDGLLCLLTDKIDTRIIEGGERLKVVSNYAVGYDNIDVETATKKGIYVTNTPGVLTETTADLAWAILMAIARRVAEADRYVRGGKWVHAWGPKMMLGIDVHSKTLGIVGLGRIGSAVARRAKGFNMKVIYYDIFRREDLEKELGLEFKPLDELLSKADFITLHVPLTKDTYHLIGEREFSLMKRTAFLINTSRGAVVDEKALYKALKGRRITGAALDVFEKEPIDPDNPLLELDNVVLTPHIGSASIETRKKMAMMAAENLVSVLRGEEPPNLVNPEVREVRPLKPRS